MCSHDAICCEAYRLRAKSGKAQEAGGFRSQGGIPMKEEIKDVEPPRQEAPRKEGDGAASQGSADSLRSSEYPLRALVRADADDYPVNGVHRGDVYGFRKDGRNPGYRARGRYEDVYFCADELIIDPTPEQIAEERAKAGLPAEAPPAPADGTEAEPSSLIAELVSALNGALFAMGAAGANADVHHPLRPAWEDARKVLARAERRS
jgi:hypothetical protein